VNEAVAQWCAEHSTEEVVARFLAIEVPVGPVRGAFAAIDDPQVRHRGALVPLLHPDRAEPSGYVGAAFPVRLSRADTAPPRPPSRSARARSACCARCSESGIPSWPRSEAGRARAENRLTSGLSAG
jgi:crotonobetainyl-CoA:carnitine CoA-transferase CaiB-like acyl-CoA transferase